MSSSDPASVIARARTSLHVFLREGRRPDDLHAAIRIWKRLAPLMPESVEPHTALADLYSELRLFPEAKASLLTAADRSEGHGNLPNADAALRRILEFDPTDLKTRARLADLGARQGLHHRVVGQHLAIALRLAATGHVPQAIQVLERGLRKAGEHPELRRQLDALVQGHPPAPRGEESMSLPLFQLLEIFDRGPLTAVLDRPAWAAVYAEFARQRASPDALVRSRVVVPAEIVRAVVRECPCRLVLYAGPDGATLHLGGPELKPEWFFHDSTGRLVTGEIPETVLLTTEQAFEDFGAHPVWLALEYGSSYKGERYRMFQPSATAGVGP